MARAEREKESTNPNINLKYLSDGIRESPQRVLAVVDRDWEGEKNKRWEHPYYSSNVHKQNTGLIQPNLLEFQNLLLIQDAKIK